MRTSTTASTPVTFFHVIVLVLEAADLAATAPDDVLSNVCVNVLVSVEDIGDPGPADVTLGSNSRER